jgi:dephospho-CoA kinase
MADTESGSNGSEGNGRTDRAVLVGLTGGYCVGKNTASDAFRERGYLVIDVDTLGHAALESASGRILAEFGSEFINPDGSVNRRALGQIAFRDREFLGRLEAIVHPAANAMAEEIVALNPQRPIAINAALLFRMPLAERCATIFVITAPFLARFRRARERDGIGLTAFIRRIRNQESLAPQRSSENVDIHTVRNSASPDRMKGKIGEILARKGL